jgi:prepilin-type N-terminal cleavage/methylation domain-containing protein
MKGVKPPGGYTIVEVMIVLAVSGVMFVMAANFINGKNARTQFQQGSNELGSRMQGVIEEVTDGQYTDIPFTCSRAGASLAVTGAVRPQGTNPECVFIGKLAHFSVNPNPSGFGSGDRTKYEVFTLAGERSIGSTQPDLTNTHIVAVEEYPPLAIPQINQKIIHMTWVLCRDLGPAMQRTILLRQGRSNLERNQSVWFTYQMLMPTNRT